MAANRRLALMIDGDNAEAKLLPQVLAEVSRYGIMTIRRVYGDWTTTQLKGWKEILHTYALKPEQQFSYTTGKNSTDSALIIDAMDIIYTAGVDGICIVSSDSDYTRLATRIREKNLFVMGIGRKLTPRSFVNACDIFVYTENLPPVTEDEETPPSIEEEVEDWTYYEGLFDLYLDPESGDLSMVIDAEDLGKEYIHFIQTRDGVLEAGHFRGSYRGEMVFRIEKSYDKIEFIQENTSFYFDPESPISRAKDANISASVLAAVDIEVTEEDEDGNPTRYLIDAGELFLDEVFAQIKPSSRGGGGDRFSWPLRTAREDLTSHDSSLHPFYPYFGDRPAVDTKCLQWWGDTFRSELPATQRGNYSRSSWSLRNYRGRRRRNHGLQLLAP